jgi:hypothetical protein
MDRMRKRRSSRPWLYGLVGLVVIVLIVYLLANAGGGGDEGDSDTSGADSGQVDSGDATGEASPEPEASTAELVEDAIRGFLASGDAAIVCEEVVTERFLRNSYGDRQGCVDAQGPGSAARSVRVTAVEEAEKAALAVAVPRGGPNGGENLEVELVFENGAWRIDGISSDAPVGP